MAAYRGLSRPIAAPSGQKIYDSDLTRFKHQTPNPKHQGNLKPQVPGPPGGSGCGSAGIAGSVSHLLTAADPIASASTGASSEAAGGYNAVGLAIFGGCQAAA